MGEELIKYKMENLEKENKKESKKSEQKPEPKKAEKFLKTDKIKITGNKKKSSLGDGKSYIVGGDIANILIEKGVADFVEKLTPKKRN